MYLDPARVDITCCTAVMSHLRGRLPWVGWMEHTTKRALTATLRSFLRGPPRVLIHCTDLAVFPQPVRLRLQDASSVTGVILSIDNDALVWHDVTIGTLIRSE